MSRLEQILLDVSASPLIDEGRWHQASRLLLTSTQNGLQVARVSLWFFREDAQYMQCHLLLEHGVVCEEDILLHASVFPVISQHLPLSALSSLMMPNRMRKPLSLPSLI